ncbi:methyltransferase domain-containing protein [Devosia sp.]|uniref:class I SAM-dependent methyltransferase n=1 Tax=Devosia sp. TaxID=1871048 RepID=UPI003262E220
MPAQRSSAAKLAARAWVEVSDLLDLQLSPLGLRAIDALAPVPGEIIVDIGCGAGQSTVQLAARVGPTGRVIGLDIAPELLAVARHRSTALPQLSFVEGDAALAHLPDQSIDGLFSRFGVMAFADPIAAFANFRRMLKPSGRLAFVCWRALADNELDLLPIQSAGLDAKIDATPFSFADPTHIRHVLETAGFQHVTVSPHDEMVSSGTADDMATVLLRVGPLGKILRENPDLLATAEPRLRAALAHRTNHGQVSLNAATWIVTADQVISGSG